MQDITILYDGTNYTRAWLEALIWVREELKECGYNIVFYGREEYSPSGVISEIPFGIKEAKENEFDIVFCVYHNSGDLCDNRKQTEILNEIKKRCNYLVWFDAADSTGDARFHLTRIVDCYLKQQLLSDPKYYLKPLYGTRLWCDYFHNTFGINDQEFGEEAPALNDLDMMNKVGLSWNFGFSKQVRDFPKKCPDIDRSYDLHYRGTTYDRITHIMRKLTIDSINRTRLNALLYAPNPNERINHEQYIKELHDSRAVISPFGWGELCFRDFETFAAGACLIKPSVSHMISYPNCFVEYETYLPLKWDYSNFDSVVEKIMDKNYAFEIAKKGKDIYDYYSEGSHAKELFIKHLLSQLKFQ